MTHVQHLIIKQINGGKLPVRFNYLERVEIKSLNMVNLLSLVDELLIGETSLEGVIECVRDFNIYAGVLGENENIVRSHKSPEKGNVNKEIIK
jgi:hypothetical protein